mmetsp:Transcript_16409/g.51325  ORF Transcript_16409/g.51325 Transcript_16409/m.51325 type:complete len:283 (+) Transcript_16409:277-1125(+)
MPLSVGRGRVDRLAWRALLRRRQQIHRTWQANVTLVPRNGSVSPGHQTLAVLAAHWRVDRAVVHLHTLVGAVGALVANVALVVVPRARARRGGHSVLPVRREATARPSLPSLVHLVGPVHAVGRPSDNVVVVTLANVNTRKVQVDQHFTATPALRLAVQQKFRGGDSVVNANVGHLHLRVVKAAGVPRQAQVPRVLERRRVLALATLGGHQDATKIANFCNVQASPDMVKRRATVRRDKEVHSTGVRRVKPSVLCLHLRVHQRHTDSIVHRVEKAVPQLAVG